MKYNKIIGFLILLVFYNCSKTKDDFTPYFQEENGLKFVKKASLKEKSIVQLSLDSVSSYNGLFPLRYSVNSQDSEYVSFLNFYDNSIKYYSLEEPHKINTINLSVEGPNGVGLLNPNSAHVFISKDSLCVYNENNGKLFFVDNQGKLFKTKDVSFYEKKNFNLTFPAVFSPDHIIKAKNEILISCFTNGELTPKKTKTILQYDFLRDTIKYIMPYPKAYTNAYWGAMYKYVPSMAYNSKTSKTVISYPISSFVYIMDMKNGVKDSVYVGSKYIKQAIPPYSFDTKINESKNRDWEKENEFSGTNSNYYCIIYDDFRDVYYIVVAIRPTLEERNRTGEYGPNFSIIICDNKFNKIGETEIFDTDIYGMSNIMLVKDGLAISRPDLYRSNENNLCYSIFNLEYND